MCSNQGTKKKKRKKIKVADSDKNINSTKSRLSVHCGLYQQEGIFVWWIIKLSKPYVKQSMVTEDGRQFETTGKQETLPW